MSGIDQTYVGPRGPGDADPQQAFFGGSSNKPGGSKAALIVAIIATVLSVIGIWMAANADSHADAVGGGLAKLAARHEAFAKETVSKVNAMQVQLSAEATAITVLNDAVAKLQSKAEQSVVDQLNAELKTKASRADVRDLADQLLNKADARTVRRLSRRMSRFDGRLKKVEDLVLPPPPPVDQPPPPQPAASTPPAAAPLLPPGNPHPGGKVEAPAKPVTPVK